MHSPQLVVCAGEFALSEFPRNRENDRTTTKVVIDTRLLNRDIRCSTQTEFPPRQQRKSPHWSLLSPFGHCAAWAGSGVLVGGAKPEGGATGSAVTFGKGLSALWPNH